MQESWGDESELGLVGFQDAARGLDKSQADSMTQQHEGEAELASPGGVLQQAGKASPCADTNNVGFRSGDMAYWLSFARELARMRAGNSTPTSEEATRFWQQVTETLGPETAELQQGIGVDSDVSGAACAERQPDRREGVVVTSSPDSPPRLSCGPVLQSRPASVPSEACGAMLVAAQYSPLRRSDSVETVSELDVSDTLQTSGTEIEAVAGGLVRRSEILQHSGTAEVVEEEVEVEDEVVVESILITPIMSRRVIRGGSRVHPTLGVPPDMLRDAVLSLSRSPYDGM